MALGAAHPGGVLAALTSPGARRVTAEAMDGAMARLTDGMLGWDPLVVEAPPDAFASEG